MKLSNQGSVPVYTIAGASTARPLPEWLARKRKRSLKRDPEFANRIELLQDFEFEEASSCVRVSEDGDWAMSTGTYKPQMHTHYLPHLALSYARNTNALNQTFILLSSDYSKSLHLQSDRFLEFHTPGGLHYSTRIPRYGRDLKYSRRNTEALIPAVGLGADGNGEVFRLNLELGRFMKGYDVDLGQDRMNIDTGLQGGIDAEAVNAAAVAEHSHNLLAFGTSLGTVEFWDDRSRSRVGLLQLPRTQAGYGSDSREEISVLEFKASGLQLALGTSTGIINLYDLRSPTPLLKKEQGYDFPIQNIKFLESELAPDKVMSADKRIIKIWDAQTGDAWTSIEPAVDLNHVEWIPRTGMFLTANEGRQQHAFLIPQLGSAPKWCAFLDNLVEEMAEDAEDPNAFGSNKINTTGAVYDNYKFLSIPQLRELNLDHLMGQTSLLRPYMHGYFVAQKLYEQARLISNPDLFIQQREKSIADRIAKERESRVRGTKAVKVKVNRKLAEKMLAKEEANAARKARRVLRQGGDEAKEAVGTDQESDDGHTAPVSVESTANPRGVLSDSRFAQLFEDQDFEIDETSREFALQNPSTMITSSDGRRTTASASASSPARRLTAAEEEDRDAAASRRSGNAGSSETETSSGSEDEEDIAARNAQRTRRDKPPPPPRDDSRTGPMKKHSGGGNNNNNNNSSSDKNRVSSASYRKAGHDRRGHTTSKSGGAGPKMVVSSSTAAAGQKGSNRVTAGSGNTFGALVAKGLGSSTAGRGPNAGRRQFTGRSGGGAVGEKSVTFAPSSGGGKRRDVDRSTGAAGAGADDDGRGEAGWARGKDRRSASGNVFRRM